MAIDPKSLPPKYQAQIAQKLLKRESVANLTQEPRKAKSKYNNTPTERDGAEGRKIRFDSNAEARRYDELMVLLRAGKIRKLKLQPEWTLQEAYTTPEGERIRAERYRADFSYYRPADGVWSPFDEGNAFVVEDVKSRATRTAVYRSKKKRMLEKYGIQIVEVEM